MIKESDNKKNLKVKSIQLETYDGVNTLQIVYKDEKGQPWLCRRNDGTYVDQNNIPVDTDSLAAMAEYGLIG